MSSSDNLPNIDDDATDWNSILQEVRDATANDSSPAQESDGNNPSTQLIRRDTNQEVSTLPQIQAPQPVPYSDEVWSDIGPSGTPSGWEGNDGDEPELERQALIAKRDAQAKRKQIPPFIQKLSR